MPNENKPERPLLALLRAAGVPLAEPRADGKPATLADFFTGTSTYRPWGPAHGGPKPPTEEEQRAKAIEAELAKTTGDDSEQVRAYVREGATVERARKAVAAEAKEAQREAGIARYMAFTRMSPGIGRDLFESLHREEIEIGRAALGPKGGA